MARKFLTPLRLLTKSTNPASGATGDIYYNSSSKNILAYDGSSWVSAGGGVTVTTADTAPGSPAAGDIWFDSVNTRTYVYYNDGTSSQWVEASSPVAAVGLLDGGSASSTYGGIASINAGSA